MAVVVESTATANTTSSTSLTITKPTGLAVGDLMVAVLSGYNGTISTLSGWTLAANAASSQTTSNVQYKIAESSDVLASNFTFTFGSSNINTGAILRCSGAAEPDALDDTATGVDNSDSGTTVSFSSSVTPTTDGALLVIPLAVEGSSSSPVQTMSGYFVTGDTPTWTELYDQGITGAGTPTNAGAYAIQTTSAELTAFGAVWTASLDHTSAVLAVFNASVDASGSNTLVTTTTTLPSQSGACDGVASHDLVTTDTALQTQTGETTSPTQWTNESKESTTWTNESL